MSRFEVGRWQLLDILGDAVEGWVIFTDQGAACVVHEAAELAGADIVDPLDRRARVGDDILAMLVVEVTETHF